jgi:UDP-N-acetylglucosamine acyltransferase
MVHQFVSIGAHAMTAIATVLLHDLPTYVLAAGNTAKPFGINSEGLKRRGFSAESIARIKSAYRTLYRANLSLEQARKALQAMAEASPEIAPLAEFLADSRRSIIR